MISLLQLSENDKRLIIVLLLLFILIFVIVGYFSLLIKKIMKFQSRKADDMLHDVVVAKVITDEKKLRKFGLKKNWRQFFKDAGIPMIILACAWILFIFYGIFNKEGFAGIDVFDPNTKGIGTLFYTYKWSETPTAKFFGITLMSDWPPIATRPHFVWSAWFSYLFVPANLVGGIWYLICVQAYIARSFRIIKLSKTVFTKTLEAPAPTQVNPNENSTIQ